MASTATLWVLVLVIFAVDAQNRTEPEGPYKSDDHRGWGKYIEWIELSDAWIASRELNKPMMLVVQNSWCPMCKGLRPQFEESEDIRDLSSNFVMTQRVEKPIPPLEIEQYDPTGGAGGFYTPDGDYMPRILFFDPNGKIIDGIRNEFGNRRRLHYYFTPKSIINSMENVMKIAQTWPPRPAASPDTKIPADAGSKEEL